MTIILGWEAFKDWLAASLQVTHWTLHVIVGIALFPIFSKLLRKPLRSPVGLLPLAFLELLNETSDFLRYYIAGWPWSGYQTSVEVCLTILPPLMILILARMVWRYRSVA
jgi:hypothetical protein